MKFKTYLSLLAFCLLGFFGVLLIGATMAQDSANPTINDVFTSITLLVKNWPALKGMALISAIIMCLTQVLKYVLATFIKSEVTGNWIRAIVTFLGVLSGIFLGAVGGVPWAEAIVAGLFTSGGAVAIWEAFKPLMKKAKQTFLEDSWQ